ncbi:restriction endonuclease subunit S [Enterobacter asburiae]
MAKYKAYPEYKDSGVEWVGEIPEHWKMSKVRYCFSFDKGLTITKENLQDEGIPCLNYGEIHSKYGFEFNPSIHPLKCVDKKYLNDNIKSLICKGDIIFADTSEDIIGSGNFSQLFSEVITFAGYHTIISRPINRESYRYLAYILDSQELRSQIQTSVKGVKVFSISQAILRGLSLWLPRVNEQKNISTFLDYHTAKIDKLVEKQLQLIELLKEKRQAVISHAVTKGLNPNAPMKDSGVDWLGNIPEHWMLKRAKFIFRKMQRPISKHAGIITAFRDGHVTLRQNKRTDGFTFAIKEIGYQGVLKGDLVIHAMDGFAGAIGVSDSNGKCSPVCSVCIPYEKTLIYTYYYGYLVRQLAVTNFIQSLSKGIRERSTEFRFNEFAELPLPIPNYEEQMFIFKHIKKKEENIEELLQKQLQQIELLKERRTALISAAVTGKIDLRDWTPPASSTESSRAAEEATA